MNYTVYCACFRNQQSCPIAIGTESGQMLPPAELAENYVFAFDGELDYIELFVKAHVLGRTFRNADKTRFVVV